MAIPQRWLPGGDKYEEIKHDEQRAFYDRIEEEKAHILDVLKTYVSTWTENEIENGYDPLLQRFLNESPEWDHEGLYDTIEAEINRVSELCRKGG